jgi:hypothetical protein
MGVIRAMPALTRRQCGASIGLAHAADDDCQRAVSRELEQLYVRADTLARCRADLIERANVSSTSPDAVRIVAGP